MEMHWNTDGINMENKFSEIGNVDQRKWCLRGKSLSHFTRQEYHHQMLEILQRTTTVYNWSMLQHLDTWKYWNTEILQLINVAAPCFIVQPAVWELRSCQRHWRSSIRWCRMLPSSVSWAVWWGMSHEKTGDFWWLRMVDIWLMYCSYGWYMLWIVMGCDPNRMVDTCWCRCWLSGLAGEDSRYGGYLWTNQ